MTNVEHPNATIPDSVEVPRVGALRYELGIADNFVDPNSAGDIPERWPSQPCQLPTRHRISGRAPEARAARGTIMTFHAIGMTWAGACPSIVSADLTKAISCAAP